MEKATFAGGCFWCVEAVFKRLRGVIKAQSGYAGQGHRPTYELVSTGTTPFAEAVQVEFDPAEISYETLLDVFWSAHDPTTLNQQGADIGPQYRSAIFYHNDAQKEAALKSRAALEKSGKYKNPIVTVVEPLTNFYSAEERHDDYYDRNRSQGYCRLVIDPKIHKLYKDFKDKLKNPEEE